MDATNLSDPKAGFQISGEASRAAAIKRLNKLQEQTPTMQNKQQSYAPQPPKQPERIS